MIRSLGLLFLIFFCYTRSLAIEASVAHTIFYSPDPIYTGKLAPEIEVYWQVNPRSLHFITLAEQGITANIKTDIVFSNNEHILREDHYVMHTIPRHGIQDLKSHSIIELRRYPLTTGFVRMKLTLTDLADSLHPFTFTDTFTVAVPSRTVFYSGIELLDTIIHSSVPTNFFKNGAEQVPECANFIDEYKHTLTYYAERYQAANVVKEDYPLLQKVFIAKNDDDEFYGNFIKTDTIREGAPKEVSGNFKIGPLPSGNYYLKVSLENKTHTQLASKALFFQRLNTHPEEFVVGPTKKAYVAPSDTGMESVKVLNLKKTFVAKYTLGEIKGILKMLLPFSDGVATMTIRNFLKKPDEIYMRYYVYNYFNNINRDNPGKAFKEFSEKIIEVNKLYTSHGMRGYETDRGFIYLRYGAPSDIVTVESENGSLPYEIWQYNQLKQTNGKEVSDAVFLFYRPTQGGVSDFRILHSTVDGEAKNMDWRSYLYTGGGANDNSRAEQYLGNR